MSLARAAPQTECTAALAVGKRIHYLTLQATTEGQAAHAHVFEIVRGLRRLGWEVQVFEPRRMDENRRGILRKVLEFARLQWRIIRQRRRPDLLYVRAHPLALWVVLWARLSGICAVAEVNSTYEDIFSVYPWTKRLQWLVEKIGDCSIRPANGFITVTSELKLWLEERFPAKLVRVVPNGANTDLFHPGVVPALVHLAPYVIFVGAMSAWQGIEVLLAATKDPAWPLAVRLVLVGDGPARAQSEAKAADNERVCFLGTQSYQSIPALLTGATAAFSVGTSLRRNFSPLKLFEALACGTPVVVSDQPGQAALVRELGCGLVVPSGDATSVALAVAYLINNREQARGMGNRGFQAVAAEHSWQRRAEETSAILLDVVGPRDAVAGGQNRNG